MKYLLLEDDCAPDSLAWFEEELKKQFNLTIHDFKSKGRRATGDDYIKYHYQGYILSIYADDQHWHLSKEE